GGFSAGAHGNGESVRAVGVQVRLYRTVATLSLRRRAQRVSVDDLLGVPRVELAEVLNHVLDKGVVLRGEVMLAVADIDLVKLDLGLLLTAVESVMRTPPVRSRRAGLTAPGEAASDAFGPTAESAVLEALPAP